MIKAIKVLTSRQKSKKEIAVSSNNVYDIFPIKDIKEGILITENDYIAFIEVMPINLKLKSEREQEYITQKYEELLKIVKVPFYNLTISKKADAKEHIEYVQKHISTEKSQTVIAMAKEYEQYTLEVAAKKAVKRRFIVAIPCHIKTANFNEAKTWLYQHCITFIEAINKCGNEALFPQTNRFTAEILYQLLNVKNSEKERMPEL